MARCKCNILVTQVANSQPQQQLLQHQQLEHGTLHLWLRDAGKWAGQDQLNSHSAGVSGAREPSETAAASLQYTLQIYYNAKFTLTETAFPTIADIPRTQWVKPITNMTVLYCVCLTYFHHQWQFAYCTGAVCSSVVYCSAIGVTGLCDTADFFWASPIKGGGTKKET